jgi:hypothetical protein
LWGGGWVGGGVFWGGLLGAVLGGDLWRACGRWWVGICEEACGPWWGGDLRRGMWRVVGRGSAEGGEGGGGWGGRGSVGSWVACGWGRPAARRRGCRAAARCAGPEMGQ